jgi:hypothetical protein
LYRQEQFGAAREELRLGITELTLQRQRSLDDYTAFELPVQNFETQSPRATASVAEQLGSIEDAIQQLRQDVKDLASD